MFENAPFIPLSSFPCHYQNCHKIFQAWKIRQNKSELNRNFQAFCLLQFVKLVFVNSNISKEIKKNKEVYSSFSFEFYRFEFKNWKQNQSDSF